MLLILLIIVIVPLIKINFIILEWEFLSFKINIYFNRVLFSLILAVVTLTVLIFRTYYLNNELNFNYYYFVLLIFVGRIFMLNFSNNVLAILIR